MFAKKPVTCYADVEEDCGKVTREQAVSVKAWVCDRNAERTALLERFKAKHAKLKASKVTVCLTH